MSRRGKTAVACFIGVAVLMGFPGGGTATLCEAKETVSEREVAAFVEAYQKALSPEGIETLADYVDNPESQDFQIDLLRQRVTLKECGIKGWENIKVLVLPMSDGKHWLAAVSSELIVEGFDVGIPGLRVVLVGRDKEGELKISSYAYDDYDVYSEAFIKEMRELSLSDEIVERNNEIANAYNELVAERSDILEWALETSKAIDKEVGEMLAQEDAISEKANSEEKKPGAQKGSYLVKKGDCLWSIAEEQLGDGMKWGGLYEQNKDVIGEDPNLLYVGIILQLN